MRKTQPLEFSLFTIAVPLFSVLLLWIIYWVEIRFHVNLTYLGVQPQSLIGLRGIVFSPFIHGSIDHLYSNSIPLLVLLIALLYFYKPIALKVILWGAFLTGLLTWLIADKGSVHIGASGIVYLLSSFLFFKGIWSKHYRLIALSLIVVFLYGSLIWGLLPGEEGISWEGHLSGFLSGIVFAFIYKKSAIPTISYAWEKPSYNEHEDEFMKHFDENGNFVPSSELYKEEEQVEAEASEESKNLSTTHTTDFKWSSDQTFQDKNK
ncbi:rhomboid family intramembrane serine protease [Mesonia ostreae]|uniref:Rhomboid family intramembrane serine protease n=1 Tax=Mesonia ostreae TaxID=861110 RepID=A0ABU2KLD6_9FLAO|nr:rhomboid family intramembrane serine protease [Mesonia ostreae]MDT0295533.1 rhomboid family intramembrane serine protease [Mesonia ostreae]